MQDFADPKNNILKVDFEKNTQSLEQKLLSEKKRQLFEQWLNKGLVTLLLDARSEGVKVPEDFKSDGDMRLNFSYAFHLVDFAFNNSAVWATLSFTRGPFLCHVPWSSVYGLQSAVLKQGAVWFCDFPADYDQRLVLGFAEQDEHDEQVSEYAPENNVIEYDFTGRKDLVK